MIDAGVLLNSIASDLQDYGRFTVAESPTIGFLEEKLQSAIVDAYQKHPWPFLRKQAQLKIIENCRGPYDPPADFAGFVPAKKNSDFYAYDYYGVPNPIGDGPGGRKHVVYWDEVSNKIWFVLPPSNCVDKTFTYLVAQSENPIDDLANWPNAVWLTRFLNHRTRSYALQPTADFTDQAQSEMALSESMLNAQIRILQRSGTKPATRDVAGIQGDPVWKKLQGLN